MTESKIGKFKRKEKERVKGEIVREQFKSKEKKRT